MLKRVSCILTVLVMIFCLSSGSYFRANVFADDDTSMALPSKGTLTAGTYKLTSDVTITSYVTVSSGTVVTIDLCGYSIVGSVGPLITVNGGTLNLIDSSENGTGCITNKLTSSYAIKVANNGTLNMYGGNVTGAYGIYMDDTSCVVNITAGSVTGTKYNAVYNKKGTVTISGTENVSISALASGSDKYGIYCGSGGLTISNPNTYVSASSASKAVYKQATTNMNITAGHYSTTVERYVTTEGYSCNETDDADYPYVVTADVVEPEVVLPAFYGCALTLDGYTGVTFYYDMTGVSNPDSFTLTAKIGSDGEEQSISAGTTKTLDNGITYYRYTVYVKPHEFSTPVYVRLTDGTNVTETRKYSVEEYCMSAIEDNLDEADLCKALLNYGDYATAFYTGVSSQSLESIEGWVDPVTAELAVDLSEYSGTDTPGTAKGLLLGSSVVIRIYLMPDVASESDSFTYNGTALELYAVDDESYSYYIEFPVPASDMSSTLTVYKNGEEFTSYSVLSYVYNIVQKEGSSDSALVNLCKAIYYYSVAADNYDFWH
ncbi:MAG: hypothetical protein LUG86_07070 [Oscillospiraceae bacterium]|nr:hypothetical protein [Oscillospiraceae bacterium]